MGDLGNFNTVLQFCVKSIIKKIPKIQMGTLPNLTTAEVKPHYEYEINFEILLVYR